MFENDIDFNDVKLEKFAFVKGNYQPAVDEHLRPNIYVDNAIDEPNLVRNYQDNDFNSYNLTNINSFNLNTQALKDNKVITKSFVDQFHQENKRSRRDLVIEFYNESSDLVKNNQDNDFNHNNMTNVISIIINRGPTSDNEVSNKKHIDDELDQNTILRFEQTIQNYLRVSVGNDTCNLTKYDKIHITDTTIIESVNTGLSVLPY